MMKSMMQQFILNPHDSTSSNNQSTSADAIAASICESMYDPDSRVAFDSWFKRWEDIFRVDFAKTDDAWKVPRLLCNLGTKEHERYTNTILPQNPRNLTFDDSKPVVRNLWRKNITVQYPSPLSEVGKE
ncbi:Gag-Pol polyprotein [Fasciola hepatica]|uniref:Gag-Pol polyprotein n=1 Tax=Fasciola hepatica TaxID=6192 RepID=A0A4E0RVX4_FASHE|nr:Gag-Pol polyprotein [Fasciola hepatica]